MLRKAACRAARMKKGQRSWTPYKVDATSRGSTSAPSMLTAKEMREFVYRPLPPEHTVEYEEDFGHNILIQREYYSPKLRKEAAAFELVPLCESSIELRKGRERLANIKAMEEHGAQVTADGAVQPVVESSVNENDPIGSIEAARYLFDEKRMKYVERFDRLFLHLSESDQPDKGFKFNALKEACAIVFGCESDEAREGWLRKFLMLDRASLEEEAEMVRGLLASGERINRRASPAPTIGTNEDGIEGEDGALAEAHVSIPHEYAPLVESYRNFSMGKTRIAGAPIDHLKGSVGASSRAQERQKYRAMIERLVNEDFASWTDEDLLLAEDLSDQLRTLKLFDAKVGESVREAVQLQHRAASGGSQHDVRSTVDRARDAPEARTADDGTVPRNLFPDTA